MVLPDRKFNFGDRVTVTVTNDTGEVIGIWLKECGGSQRRWMYRLDGLHRFTASWWQEDSLKPCETPTQLGINTIAPNP
jgi:hypothetical protein